LPPQGEAPTTGTRFAALRLRAAVRDIGAVFQLPGWFRSVDPRHENKRR